MSAIEKEVATMLLDCGAVKIQPDNPFTWASGWKSPIYCDNRLTLSYPSVRRVIRDGLTRSIREAYPKIDAIAGVATAGIPQGALVADALDLPFLYVRSKPKDHGMENLIEGKVDEGANIAIIEDLISTGGSSIKAANALRDAGYHPLGVVAVFTYGFDVARDKFMKAGLPYQAICDYESLVSVALEESRVKESELASLKSWREDPANWQA